MKFGKTWLVKNASRWQDFTGYLYGKGYRNLCGNIHVLVELGSLKEDGRTNIVGNSFSVVSVPNEDCLVMSFSGSEEIGVELVEKYLSLLPEECRDDIS